MSSVEGSGPMRIHTKADVEHLQSKLAAKSSQIKLKFINKTRAEFIRHQDTAKTRADTLDTVSKVGFGVAGLLAAVSVGLVIAAKVAVIASSAALAATPIGWAVLGIVAVCLTVLAIRHFVLKEAHLKTDTGQRAAQSLAVGIGTFASVAVILASLIVGAKLIEAMTEGSNMSFFEGYFLASMLTPTHTQPIILYAPSGHSNTFSHAESVKEKQQNGNYVFKDDYYKIGQDGSIRIVPYEAPKEKNDGSFWAS